MGLGRYFTLLIILFLNALGMTLLVFGLKQNFVFEFFLMIIFLFLSIIILIGVYNNKNWAWKLASIYFIAFLINNFYLYLNTISISSRFSITTLLSSLGFVIATASISDEPELEEIEVPPPKVKVRPYGEKTATKTARAQFKPGKYIASKTGAVYHIGKCDWAKKIKNKNRLWLKDKAEARKKGFKKHSCVK